MGKSDEQKICRYCAKKVDKGVLHPKRHDCDVCGHRTHHACLVPKEERLGLGIEHERICRACARNYRTASESAPPGHLRIAVIADVHLGASKKILSDGRPSAKELAAYYKAKKTYNRREILTILDQVTGERPDVIIFAGDATINGTGAEIDDAGRYFRAAFGELPVVGVPGNHDFWSFNHNEGRSLFGLPLDQEMYPIATLIRPKLAVVAICTPSPPFNLLNNAIGDIGIAQLHRLDDMLANLDMEKCRCVIVLHHPFRHHDDAGDRLLRLRDADALETVLARHPSVAFAVAGHLHENWVCRCGPIPLVAAPSVARQEFLILDIELAGPSVTSFELCRCAESRVERHVMAHCNSAKRR
jgi:hypothetical protein